jgi:hypothetical protein
MYKCTIYDTTHFKAVMVMNLSELRSEACFCESNHRMGDLLGSLVWKAKSGQYCVIGGGSLQMVSEPLPNLRWWERAQANEGRQRGRWVQRWGDCDVPHRLGMRICLYV